MPARRKLPIAAVTATAALLGLAVALLIASPSSGGAGSAGAAGAAEPGVESAGKGPGRAVLRLKNSRFGKVIFEKKSGLVAYIFTKDKRNKSKCYGPCAKGWPPIKTRKRPKAGKGLKQKHVRMIKRRNGSRMVTYKGRPLYFYEDDSPGTIFCHDVRQFGGDWFVIKKDGKPA